VITSSTLESDRPLETPGVSTGPRTPSPFYWSVRCELWRSPWVAFGPLVAAFMLVPGYAGTLTRPSHLGQLLAAGAGDRIGSPYALAVAMVALGAFFVGLVYSLFAMGGERRDRSILFWKSLPVSDTTTVLAKAAVVFAVLPLVVLAVAMLAHAAMLVIGSTAMLMAGDNPVALWREVLRTDRILVYLYGIGTLYAQHAPLYAWLLMISAWAPRLAVLWALLPPYAIVAGERMMFGHSRVQEWVRDLLIGSFTRSFGLDPSRDTMPVIDRVAQLDPAALLGRAGFWIGLLVATAFIGLAIRARQVRETV
jgi:ABC-2 type transport system permease protein